jgi:hypothetical protein
VFFLFKITNRIKITFYRKTYLFFNSVSFNYNLSSLFSIFFWSSDFYLWWMISSC